MSLRFRGGDYIQRGRGIGGLLRMAKSFFLPLMKTAGKTIIKAGKSKAGKAVFGAIKDQAISSGTNLVADVVRGNDLQESLHNEGQNIRERVADTIQSKIPKKRKKKTIGTPNKRKRISYGNQKKTDWLSD
jgi:hypothetical protein